ncbi:MAG: D-tyrosyl-tRNA(Tyr) deacylase [Acidimicrobiia bacterium]|nr:D-tyrosyl-tRNA(Tyr) deacylase [Acidimicrobiia bacterium]
MRVVLQRVRRAAVSVGGEVVGSIGTGLVALVGVAGGDVTTDAAALATKTADMRLFPNPGAPDDRPMDVPLAAVQGAVLAVSQFTLCADTSRGRRPSFTRAASPDAARPIFDAYCATLQDRDIRVETGVFGAHMEVDILNDGPVTIVLDSEVHRG